MAASGIISLWRAEPVPTSKCILRRNSRGFRRLDRRLTTALASNPGAAPEGLDPVGEAVRSRPRPEQYGQSFEGGMAAQVAVAVMSPDERSEVREVLVSVFLTWTWWTRSTTWFSRRATAR